MRVVDVLVCASIPSYPAGVVCECRSRPSRVAPYPFGARRATRSVCIIDNLDLIVSYTTKESMAIHSLHALIHVYSTKFWTFIQNL